MSGFGCYDSWRRFFDMIPRKNDLIPSFLDCKVRDVKPSCRLQRRARSLVANITVPAQLNIFRPVPTLEEFLVSGRRFSYFHMNNRSAVLFQEMLYVENNFFGGRFVKPRQELSSALVLGFFHFVLPYISHVRKSFDFLDGEVPR